MKHGEARILRASFFSVRYASRGNKRGAKQVIGSNRKPPERVRIGDFVAIRIKKNINNLFSFIRNIRFRILLRSKLQLFQPIN